MTEYEIRADGKILIKGYVNAVGRDSNPVYTADGRAVEQIEPGAFTESLKNRSDVNVLLNHRADRKLASTSDGTAKIYEDNIGLRAEVLTADEDVKYKAQNGLLAGWSFGFYGKETEMEQRAEQIPRRHVKKLDMYEISIIDNTMSPCYAGTSIEYRADEVPEYRAESDEFTLSKEALEALEKEKRAWINTYMADVRINAYKNLPELRYNPYHNPADGRFTTANGGGMGGYLYVGKGEKGKGQYVYDEYESKLAQYNEKFKNNRYDDEDKIFEEYDERIRTGKRKLKPGEKIAMSIDTDEDISLMRFKDREEKIGDNDYNYLYFKPWQNYGKNRTYVNDYKDRQVAWIDNDTGAVNNLSNNKYQGAIDRFNSRYTVPKFVEKAPEKGLFFEREDSFMKRDPETFFNKLSDDKLSDFDISGNKVTGKFDTWNAKYSQFDYNYHNKKSPAWNVKPNFTVKDKVNAIEYLESHANKKLYDFDMTSDGFYAKFK